MKAKPEKSLTYIFDSWTTISKESSQKDQKIQQLEEMRPEEHIDEGDDGRRQHSGH